MAKKVKIPKRIAGFKVPRALRKSKAVRQMLGSQLGREVLAGALTAAAGAAATVLAAKHDDTAPTSDGDIKDTARKASGTIAEALETALTTALGIVTEALDQKAANKRPTQH